jgi:hypothetical protein
MRTNRQTDRQTGSIRTDGNEEGNRPFPRSRKRVPKQAKHSRKEVESSSVGTIILACTQEPILSLEHCV